MPRPVPASRSGTPQCLLFAPTVFPFPFRLIAGGWKEAAPRRSRSDRLAGHDRLDGVGALLALVHDDVPVCLEVLEYLYFPRRPADRQTFHRLGVAQPEMDDV